MADTTTNFRIEIIGLTEQTTKLGELSRQLLDLRKQETDLNKSYKEGKTTAEDYAASMGKLKNQKASVTMESRTLERAMSDESKAVKLAAGSMAEKSLLLEQLKVKYKFLSEEERNNASIGGVMLQNIQKQDTEMKKLDATIGNHQRNVGNYSSGLNGLGGILSGLMPGFSGVQNSVTNITNVFKTFSSTVANSSTEINNLSNVAAESGGKVSGLGVVFGVVGVAILGAIAVAGSWKSIVESTDATSDKFHETIGALNSGFQYLKKSIATMDFSNFFSNMGEAIRQGKEYVKTLDQIEDRNRALTIRSAETRVQVLEEMKVYRDATKSREERIAAIDRIIELEKKDAEDNKKVQKSAIDAELQSASVFSRVSKEKVYDLLKNYDLKEKEIDQAQKLIEAENNLSAAKKLQASATTDQGYAEATNQVNNYTKIISTASKQTKDFAEVYKGFSKLTDEERKKIVDAGVKYNDALGQFDELTQRASAKKSQLIKGLDEAEGKAVVTFQKQQGQFENSLDKRGTAIQENANYILLLSQKLMDQQVAAMDEGIDKQVAAENDRSRNVIENTRKELAARSIAIDAELKEMEKKGGKGGGGLKGTEIEQYKTLQDEKLQIKTQSDQIIQGEEAVAAQKIEAIVKASQTKILKEYAGTDEKLKALIADELQVRKDAADKLLTEEYQKNLAAAKEDAKAKIEQVDSYYKTKGKLSIDEEQAEANEKKKIELDLLQFKFNLLKKEVEARTEAGTISKEESAVAGEELINLYNQVRIIQDDIKNGDKQNIEGEITSFIGSVFTIKDDEAAQILAKAKQLGNQIIQYYEETQRGKIARDEKASITSIEKKKNAEIKALDAQLKSGKISKDKYDKLKAEAEEKAEKESNAVRRKAFEAQKKLQLKMAYINAAAAIIGFLANPGGIAGIVLAALSVGTAALQISAINKQKYEEAALGGVIHGKSHREGGAVIEAEGGEAVINKRSMSSNDRISAYGTPREIASMINSYRGYGHKFADGGMIPASTPSSSQVVVVGGGMDSDQVGAAIADRISAIPVIVSESDITGTQRRVKVIQNDARY